MRLSILRLLTTLAFVVGAALPAHAHEFALDAPLTAFVRVEGMEARIAVRAPLFLFKQVRFPQRGAMIDVANAGPAMQRALGALAASVALLSDGMPLAPASMHGRLSLPADRSFQTFERAVAHIAGPLEPDVEIVADQGFVDAVLTYPLPSPDSVLSIRTAIAPELGQALKVALRFEGADGEQRAMLIAGTSRAVALNPTPLGAAATFVGLGIRHIATGVDHLLFLLCLLIPLRGFRQIVVAITGFTVAHSATLVASAFGLAPGGAWFPPLVETAIAASIVYVALENIVGADVRRRVVLTILFGLVHGFGFAYGLREELQFAGSHLVVSLLAFNVGIEIGQLMMVALMLPLLALARRYLLPGRVGTIILSAVIAHTGWHWMTERWEDVARIGVPAPSLENAAVALAWLAAGVLLAAVAAAIVDRLGPEPGSRTAGGTRLAAQAPGDD